MKKTIVIFVAAILCILVAASGVAAASVVSVDSVPVSPQEARGSSMSEANKADRIRLMECFIMVSPVCEFFWILFPGREPCFPG